MLNQMVKSKCTLGQALQYCNALVKDCFDEHVSIRGVEFESLDTVLVDGQRFWMRASAQNQICQMLSEHTIPIRFMRECSHHTQAKILNEFVEKETKKRDRIFMRFDGSFVRAIFTERYVPNDNHQLIQRLLEIGYPEYTKVNLLLNESMMALKIPDYTSRFEVAPNDTMFAGISIRNSEVARLMVEVMAFFLRLVCSNGAMVVVAGRKTRKKHTSERPLIELPDSIKLVQAETAGIRGGWIRARQVEVENVEETFESINRAHGIRKELHDPIDAAFVKEPGRTAFHVINSYTRAAHEANLVEEDQALLEDTGGNLVNMINTYGEFRLAA